jgi:hypothetical protein
MQRIAHAMLFREKPRKYLITVALIQYRLPAAGHPCFDIFYTMPLDMQVCSVLIGITKIMLTPAPLHYMAE